MFKVRMRDLALVAVAGGLLAFELVSIGEAVPAVKKALAERGLTGKNLVASANAAAATSTSRSGPRVRLVSLKSDGSCATSEVAISVVRLREVSKAVDQALKHSAL